VNARNSFARLAIDLCVIALVVCASVSSAQPADPVVGTWKLNLTKSKYATPAPKSMTVTFVPASKGYLVTIDAVAADGQVQRWGYTSSFDGSESAVSGNSGIDTVVARTAGSGGTVEYKKAGKVITTTSSVFSEDGKTLTVTVKTPVGQGGELTTLAVYDRQ
jgi:hypothetical protein